MLKFKSATIEITPQKPSRLTGMSENEVSVGIHSKLEINAMIFNQNEQNIFFISIDTLFISSPIKIFIQKEINKNFVDVPESDILIMSTHTHYAPSLEERRIDLGKKDEEYFAFLKVKIMELIQLLNVKIFFEVEIDVQNGKTEKLTSNRRRKARNIRNYFKPFIAMEPNLNGFKNEKFDIINIYHKQDKKLAGLVFTFPCHPTNLFDKKLVSAEFPGGIRDLIRNKQNSNDLSIIYMPGFAGNVRAYPPHRKSIGKFVRDLLQLTYPVYYYRFQNKVEYDNWLDSLMTNFMNIWQEAKKTNINIQVLTSKMIKKPIKAIFDVSVEDTEDIIFRKISFGDQLAFFTISAEVVAEYSQVLDKIFKEDFSICTGYVDEVFGYLPTVNQINEGGYESGGYFKEFLVKGKFNSQIEYTIESCMKELN
jgi:neutral ceramidase